MNTLRIRTVISLLVAFVIGIFAVGFFTPTASAADCPLTFEEPADVFNYAQDGTLEFSQFQKQDGQAVIVVTNNSDCELPLALGSYEMMTGNQLSEQQLHDQHQQVVPAQSSRTLKVDLPSCMSQIDLYHDPNEDGVPTPPQPANAKLIGFTFSGNEKDIFAENDIFHFSEGHPYKDLDDFPNDDDDGYRNATPSADSRYCDVPPPETCPYENNRLPIEEPADLFNFAQDGTLEFSQFNKTNGQAAISITNNSGCEFPVSLGVYEMFDNTFENQELFSEDTTVVNPNSQATVAAELPACMAQIDLLYDPNQDGPPETPSSANPDLIGFTFNQNEEDVFAENDIFHFSEGHPYEDLDNFPNDDDDSPRDAGPAANFCPSQPDPLTGTCSVDPDNPETGQTVTWSSSASGGTGNYTFSWSGDANGDTSTVNETYQTSGQKTASININDGNNTITRTCRVTVSDDDDGNGDDPTRLTIIKQVANRDGRGVTSSDFTITATPHTGNSSSYSFPGSSSGVTRDVASIRYNLSETGPEDIDYNTTYSGDCIARDNGGGQVTPESEQTATCTITNTLEDDNDDNGGGNGGGSGGGGAVLEPRDDDDDDDDGQVRGTQDPDFSVQCEPENDNYLIGQQATFNAEVSGDADNEDVTFDWENGNDLDASNDQATAQYLSAGTKSVTVTAQYDDVTESDVCSVNIRAAANQSGVRLDQLPYTGPGSTAQTLAFGLLILLIATSGSYLALRRFRSDGIPVGIPQDGKQE